MSKPRRLTPVPNGKPEVPVMEETQEFHMTQDQQKRIREIDGKLAEARGKHAAIALQIDRFE